MSRRWPRLSRRAFLLALLAYLVLRLGLATLPGYANDVDSYKTWGLYASEVGMHRAYEAVPPYPRSPIDYPPLFVYVCAAVVTVEGWIQGARAPDIDVSYFAIKLPHLLFDLWLGALLYGVVRRRRLWGDRIDSRSAGRWAALLFWFSPAVLFGSAYWGQPDGVHSSLVVAALALAAGGQGFASGFALSLAGLAKPLAAPFVPLLALVAALRGGWRRFLTTGAGGLAAAVVVFAPYWLTGRLGHTLQRVLLDVDAMPFTTVNGHSIWWILSPWRPATRPWLLGLSPKTIGVSAFLVVLGLLLWRVVTRHRRVPRSRDVDLFAAAAAIAAAFFALSTHMHENHLFTAIPLLAAVAGRSRAFLGLFVAASLASFFNMTLHDLDIPDALPGFLSAPSPVADYHLPRNYTWLQLIGTFLNAMLVAALAAVAVHQAGWRKTATMHDHLSDSDQSAGRTDS